MFAVDRQVFSPLDVEGALPSSSAHRKMLAPQNVEGAFPSSSTQQVQQVQQLHKGKEKVLEESLDDEEERDFDLAEYDEIEQNDTQTIDLETHDE